MSRRTDRRVQKHGLFCGKFQVSHLKSLWIYLVSGFKYFLCPPYLGTWSNLTDIFQMGWNHQLDIHSLKLTASWPWKYAFCPKRKRKRIQTIHFSGAFAVSFREANSFCGRWIKSKGESRHYRSLTDYFYFDQPQHMSHQNKLRNSSEYRAQKPQTSFKC